MTILYNIIFLVFAIVYLPYLLLTGRFHKDFWQRLGFFPKSVLEEIKGKEVIWLHAVSVGEVYATHSLSKSLIRRHPLKKRLVISTTTKTGNDVARRLFGQKATVVYLPLDLSWVIERVLNKFRPRIFAIVETEIWPNLVNSLAQRNIPVILINGRISPRSFKNYMKIRFFIKPVLRNFTLLCMQTGDYAERIKKMGAAPETVTVTGNMKFDAASEIPQRIASEVLANELGIDLANSVFVAGSTHPGEEKIIMEVYRKLLKDFRNLELIVAPRHVERSRDIEKLAEIMRFTPVRVSEAGRYTRSAERHKHKVLILDTMGTLSALYSIATLVFMGGSLVRKGGQNFLEAAVQGKPIIFGPNMFNFQDITDLFLSRNAVRMVKDKEELLSTSRELLAKPQERYDLGLSAKEVLEENLGASRRNLVRLERYI